MQLKKQPNKKESISKFLCDYLPIIVFFTIYKFSNTENPLIDATIYMVGVTFFALIISYILIRKISKIALFSAIILGIFGAMTIILQDETFIKIKPTIINSIFALILFYGYFAKKPLLGSLLGSQVKMSDTAWLILSLRWAIFFIALAFLNEAIWRSFSTDLWVNFKVFGMMPLSLLFTLSQVPFMMKEIKKEEGKI